MQFLSAMLPLHSSTGRRRFDTNPSRHFSSEGRPPGVEALVFPFSSPAASFANPQTGMPPHALSLYSESSARVENSQWNLSTRTHSANPDCLNCLQGRCPNHHVTNDAPLPYLSNHPHVSFNMHTDYGFSQHLVRPGQVFSNTGGPMGAPPSSPFRFIEQANSLSPQVIARVPTRVHCSCGCAGKTWIPHRPYEPSRGSSRDGRDYKERVNFMVGNKCGISISDALRRMFVNLEGRDDAVFADCRTSLSVRFEWPGYDSWVKQIRIKDWSRDSNPIDRSELATKIARLVPQFIEDMQNENSNDSRWKVGPGLIEADHLELVAVELVSRGSCQPHFRLKN